MSKRGPPNAISKERSQSPTNADSSNVSGSRKRTQSGDELSASLQASNPFAESTPSTSRRAEVRGSISLGQGITNATNVEKPKFKGLALPPPSAAIGYRKTQKPTDSTGGLALPPPSAAIGYGKNQDIFQSTGEELAPYITTGYNQSRQATNSNARPLRTLMPRPTASSASFGFQDQASLNTEEQVEAFKQKTPRSRNRASRACDRCHANKWHCQEKLPCRKCSEDGAECTNQRMLWETTFTPFPRTKGICVQCRQFQKAPADQCDGKNPCRRCLLDELRCTYGDEALLVQSQQPDVDTLGIAPVEDPELSAGRGNQPREEKSSRTSAAPKQKKSNPNPPPSGKTQQLTENHCDRCYRGSLKCLDHSPNCHNCRKEGLECTYKIRDR
jgi:hypothetical protein